MNRQEKIEIIRSYVPKLRAQVEGLTGEQLTTQYNPPEWTIAQNIHHLVDSHMNSYVRFKLILTEDNATLRPYDQDAFAELADACDEHIEDSLLILEGLHARWARMLDNISEWEKAGYHPELDKPVSLDDLLDIYSNHCDSHTQQIQAVLDKM
ncbi:MAG: bacillithiol transferase BstA [Phototrophicaceae bacterium]